MASRAARPPRLQHIHIPGSTHCLPSYALAVAIQSKLQQRLLDYKAAVATASEDSSRPLPPPPPPPTILSFIPAPTYTLGRRQTSPLCPVEAQRLRGRLDVYWYKHDKSSKGKTAEEGVDSRVINGQTLDHDHHYASFYPAIHNAPRGGLTTYHGPGQVVFWPVMDLKSPLHRHFSVRDYACLLEKTTIASIAEAATSSLPSFPPEAVRQKEVKGFTTENPGVWVKRRWADGDEDEADGRPGPEGEEERKIAALGVHLRRHVTGLGVAVNCSMPVRGPESYDPWRRIVACGLEGKRVTSLAYEMLDYLDQARWIRAMGPQPLVLLEGQYKNKNRESWAEAPVLETQMLRAWPEFFARSLQGRPEEASADGARGSDSTTTMTRDDLVDDLTIDEVLGKGWENTIDVPEEEQYITATRKRVVGTIPLEST
ncbi:uncharacterized protein PG986_003587 [Apiospora aurea]|uniref:BPL/LPL catalytic domain-containing protein n=1 Tax=Apiospora aurea TaxID=335848 RepID=A0ABR1QS33_9PEZI